MPERRELLRAAFAAEPSQLGDIRHRVAASLVGDGLGDAAAAEVALAVSEACANVIAHAYGGRRGGEIRVSLTRGAVDVTVRIDDDAPAVDPNRIRARPLDELRPGGLGVHFIRQLMDDVRYEPRPGGGNRLTMTRKT
jgi:sigma-B regulation protein RsbU (phosphoserine phosphatase)